MEINVGNQHYSIENEIKNIEIFWSGLNNELIQKQLVIKEIHIDGTPIYHNFYDTIISNRQTIASLDILLVSRVEICRELLKSLYLYLNNLPSQLEDLANEFYEEPSPVTWSKFKQFIEGVEWIINAVKTLSNGHNLFNDKTLTSFIEELKKLVVQMLVAVDEKDYFRLGDLLQYDFIEQIDSALVSLETSFAQ